jgi:hypothetical protein
MSSTTDESAGHEPAPADGQPTGTIRQCDPIDQPARPLGVKRVALQAQRRRHSLAAWRKRLTGRKQATKARVITSDDGTLAFAVVRTSRGLLVERRHWPLEGLRTAQTMLFDSATAFDRWCDSEPVRFDNPGLHAQLRREGHEILDDDR